MTEEVGSTIQEMIRMARRAGYVMSEETAPLLAIHASTMGTSCARVVDGYIQARTSFQLGFEARMRQEVQEVTKHNWIKEGF